MINGKHFTLMFKINKRLLGITFFLVSFAAMAQINWANDGNSYFKFENNELIRYTLPNHTPTTVISKGELTPEGASEPLSISYFKFSEAQDKILLFTNTQKVWRLNTRGDYWVFNFTTNELKQIGRKLNPSSLMFAKFSPDGTKIAFVSENNLYYEDYATGKLEALTTNGTVALINGTFDWAYEEEFACRDGFRWSPDSKSIAFWQIDASSIKKFYMINNTKDVYSELVPLEYPKVGETPSVCKVAVVRLETKDVTWMNIPGDPANHYLVRAEFVPGTNTLLLQQLNRKQNHSKLFMADATTGEAKMIYEEKDEAWVDLFQLGSRYAIDYTNNFVFLDKTNSVLWASEKDGWNHLYQVSLEGNPEVLITEGDYDVIDIKHIDTKKGYVYYLASPDNATQKYLYRTKLNGKGKMELLSPEVVKGTHDY